MSSTERQGLLSRFDLDHRCGVETEPERWAAKHRDSGIRYLLQTWRLDSSDPISIKRALWDAELRNQRRIATLPGADESLTVLDTAGVDTERGLFVMVLRTPGTLPLDQALQNLGESLSWMRLVGDRLARAKLWQGMARIARGITLLHQQHLQHRAVDEKAVMLDRDEGPASFRLSKFNHLLRWDRPGVPTKMLSGEQSFSTDWVDFGKLCARLLLGKSAAATSQEQLEQLRSKGWLLTIERDLIERLLEADLRGRLTHGELILEQLREIQDALMSRQPRPDQHLVLQAILTPSVKNAISAAMKEERESIVLTGGEPPVLPTNMRERDLLTWIEKDVASASIRVRRKDFNKQVLLVGERLIYRLVPENSSHPQPSWDIARCDSVDRWMAVDREPTQGEGGSFIPQIPIRVYHYEEIRNKRDAILRNAYSWQHALNDSTSVGLSDDLRMFHDFLRFTNQLELLFRDAEIFGYKRVAQFSNGERLYIALEENERKPPPLPWAHRHRDSKTGLFEYVDELSKEQRTVKLHLGSSDYLMVHADRGDFDRESWLVEAKSDCPQQLTEQASESDSPGREPPERLFLSRVMTPSERDQPYYGPSEGFLRSPDLFGQIHLVRRRAAAIGLLREQRYVLEALSEPQNLHFDTHAPLPIPLSVDNNLDKAKREAMEALWRTGPLFTLQGPPGSGKTHFVAHLLQQIFVDDPLAQVLVTAQAHDALDVLRKRVKDVVVQQQDPNQDPLILVRARIRRKKSEIREKDDQHYPESVAHELLKNIQRRLQQSILPKIDDPQKQRALVELRDTWQAWVADIENAFELVNTREDPPELGADAIDFLELVRRAANITFSTSTAAELADLVARTQRVDWVIVEEAGKAHGFDLVLPLQLAPRWVLIGDHRQLEPYRIRDFEKAIEQIPSVFERLSQIAQQGGKLVDRALMNDYLNLSRQQDGSSWEQPEELARLKKALSDNLVFFSALFKRCEVASEIKYEVHRAPIAAMLYQQHRMHPILAELISRAYYEPDGGRRLENSATVEDERERPAPLVRHAFIEPGRIRDRPLVFVKVPRLSRSQQLHKVEGYYEASAEVDAAERFLYALSEDSELRAWLGQQKALPDDGLFGLGVLTPYRRQRANLNHRLGQFFATPPNWLRPVVTKPGLLPTLAHTVDSFQGNQAAVVLVSLVRNNHESRQRNALGFLDDAPRMNVLLSRAERLLVLVGCWDFFTEVVNFSVDRDSPWATVIDYLSQNALFLDASELPRPPSLPVRRTSR